MYGENSSRSRRAWAATASLAANAGIAALLFWGLDVTGPSGDAITQSALTTLELRPPPPPPRVEAVEPVMDAVVESEGAAGQRSDPLPVEAPPVAMPLAPAPAAPIAGAGRSAVAGSSERGDGSGAGTWGGGEGGGGTSSGTGFPAVRIAGALRDSDYPREAESLGLAGTVGISFRVRTDGRVDRCTIERSSGHRLIDDLTCELFTRRYRFRPATDAAGQPIESTLRTSFTWGTRSRL